MLTTSTVSQWICENLIGLVRPDPWVPDHLSCLSVMLVYCGQTVEWIKMKLGMEVGLGTGHIVLDGQSRLPHFSARVCCGQTAGWIKMPLGTDVL